MIRYLFERLENNKKRYLFFTITLSCTVLLLGLENWFDTGLRNGFIYRLR